MAPPNAQWTILGRRFIKGLILSFLQNIVNIAMDVGRAYVWVWHFLCTLYKVNKRAQLTQGLRTTADSAVIPRWPSAAVLNITEPEIAPFDPPTPKTLSQNQTWIGCTVDCEIFAFKVYCDLETRVRSHSRSSKAAPLDQPTPKT